MHLALAGLLGAQALLAVQMSPADKYAMNLEQTFKSRGYDVDAVVLDKALTLTSDMFRNAVVRESEARELYNERKALCALDIWYVRVGYSKGILSGDVMKSMSLGCPAEKASRVQQMKGEREAFAESLDKDTRPKIRVRAVGTTLVFEGLAFGIPAYRSFFYRNVLSAPGSHENYCRLGIDSLQLKSKSVTKSYRVVCR